MGARREHVCIFVRTGSVWVEEWTAATWPRVQQSSRSLPEERARPAVG